MKTLTDIERQRRHRAHMAGQHDLCDPFRGCDQDLDVPASPPARLRDRGLRLWMALGGQDRRMAPEQRVVVEELARVADRLEALDESLANGMVDGTLREVRQQQLALKQLAAELRTQRGAEGGAGATGEVDPLDELQGRREDRRAGTGNR